MESHFNPPTFLRQTVLLRQMVLLVEIEPTDFVPRITVMVKVRRLYRLVQHTRRQRDYYQVTDDVM